MIQLTASFKDNLKLLPAIAGLDRIELTDAAGGVVAVIENQPGKQGSLAVYAYLQQAFGGLDAAAASFGLEIFAEITEDAKARPGAHPNIDRLLEITSGAAPLGLRVIAA